MHICQKIFIFLLFRALLIGIFITISGLVIVQCIWRKMTEKLQINQRARKNSEDIFFWHIYPRKLLAFIELRLRLALPQK
jgi:hypothetical protein